MSERNARGLGRFFGGEESPEIGIGVSPSRDGEYQQTIAALRSRVAELESAAGRPSFIDLDDDTLTQIAAEDAAVIIRAARARSTKLVEQATETLQGAEMEREQIRNSAELDARRIRDAANVDARKLRGEATATLETARDQASQLLAAAQDEADAQVQSTQATVVRLLDEANRSSKETVEAAEHFRANVEREMQDLRISTENEMAAFRGRVEMELKELHGTKTREAEELLHAATLESQRLVSEATAASQAMIERASADSRASIEEATRRHQEIVASAQERAETLVGDARSHAAEVKAAASREAENIRRAAAVYREQVLAGIDHNKDVVAELLDAFARIREHLGKSEQDALDITAHLHERRTELSEAIVELRQMPAEVEGAERYSRPAEPTSGFESAYESTYTAATSYPEPTYTPPARPEPPSYGGASLFETEARAVPPRVTSDVDSFIDSIVDEVSSEDRF